MNSLLKKIKQECDYIKTTILSIVSNYSPKLNKQFMLNHLSKELNTSSSKVVAPEMKFPVILDKPFSKYLIKFNEFSKEQRPPNDKYKQFIIHNRSRKKVAKPGF
jgi:hypothetical protein